MPHWVASKKLQMREVRAVRNGGVPSGTSERRRVKRDKADGLLTPPPHLLAVEELLEAFLYPLGLRSCPIPVYQLFGQIFE